MVTEETFKHGEVIKTRRGRSFIHHYGLVVKDRGWTYVMHNSMNSGVRIERFKDFMTDRKIEKSYGVQTEDSYETLRARSSLVRNRKYSIMTFNCEDYINHMIDKDLLFNGKIQLFIGVVIVILVLLYMWNVK